MTKSTYTIFALWSKRKQLKTPMSEIYSVQESTKKMEGYKKSFRKITVQYCNHHHLETTFQTWHRYGGRIRVLKDGGGAGQDDRTSPGVAAGKKHFSLSFRLVLSLPCHERNWVEWYCVTRVPLLLLSNLVCYQLISVICIGSSAILYWP